MWIDATKRKPDTSRRVFIREGEAIGLSKWLDFDNRWGAFVTWDDSIGIYNVEYWCEISDLLELPIEEEQEQTPKIDVHDSEYEVWVEGYAATGERGSAWRLGKYKADGFRNAVIAAVLEHGLESEFDLERMTYWGCRFFDNEADARKAYG